jgi:phosphoribosylamine---glycine ligase
MSEFPANRTEVRVLGITETCDLGSLYLRLLGEGHEVKVTISEQLAQGTMAGMLPRASDWQRELGWIRQSGEQGVIVFEAIGFGELQDRLRSEGFKVIGGSAFGDRVENDRAFAFDLLAKNGMKVAPVREFSTVANALADLHARPRRCVFKLSDSAGNTFVGTLADGADVAALLEIQGVPAGQRFILMDHVEGVETGVGAYFNGDRFLRPACLDWEHKRFFAGNLGELTGEMGTVATFAGSNRLFETVLEPLEASFRDAGHVGWVNLNTVINEEGVWPLEFTCRFGYPGFAVLEPLQDIGWGELFEKLASRDSIHLPAGGGFSVCIVLTTPPMPLSRKEVNAPVGLPLIIGDIDPKHLHLGEVGASGSKLVTAGLYGWTAVVTGTGRTVSEAKTRAYENASKVHAPNMRYRLDIGDALINGELEKLSKWGWLKSTPAQRTASQIVL